MHLKDVVCIVTGGTSGLGLGAVKRLLENGAKVIAVGRSEEKGNKLADEFKDKDFMFIRADITSEEEITKVVTMAIEKFGYINALVNSAGIVEMAPCISDDGECHSMELFEKIIKVNVTGTFNITRLVAKAMTSNKPNEEGERGVIVNVSSILAFESKPYNLAYAASKGAINSMTLPLTRNLAKYGIRVMTVAPGMFHTPMLTGVGNPDVVAKMTSSVPFPSRAGTPDEFAHLVQTIIENPMLNGEIIRIDGAKRF